MCHRDGMTCCRTTNVVDNNIPDDISGRYFCQHETTSRNVVREWLKTARLQREIGRCCLKMSSKCCHVDYDEVTPRRDDTTCCWTTRCPKIPPDDVFQMTRRPWGCSRRTAAIQMSKRWWSRQDDIETTWPKKMTCSEDNVWVEKICRCLIDTRWHLRQKLPRMSVQHDIFGIICPGILIHHDMSGDTYWMTEISTRNVMWKKNQLKWPRKVIDFGGILRHVVKIYEML